MSNWDKDREDRLREVEQGLSSHKATTDEQMKTVFKNMGTLTFEIGQLVKETARLNLNIETDRIHAAEIKGKLCSKPDMCVTLEPLVVRHEKILNQQRGGWLVLSAAGTLCGLIGGIVAWLVQTFSHGTTTH